MMVTVDEFNQLSNYYQGKITEGVLLDKAGRLAAEQLPSYHIQFHFPFVCVCVFARTCASNFLPTCILISFNADVNWLPGTASPYGYSRQLVL